MKPKVYVTRHLPESAWRKLSEACEAQSWDEVTPPPYKTILEQVKDKDGLLCLLTDEIDSALMDSAPKLRVISQCAVGYDNIDVNAATERGILVGNTPGVLTDATADFAFALLLAAARRLGEAIDFVRAGKWETWGLTLLLGQEVYGATLGILGLGRIGHAVAKRARGFDMRILYHDTVRRSDAEATLGVEYRDFDDLLRESDYVSLHVNLSEETRHLIDNHAFKIMKPSAVLINTARGPVVDTEALYDALREGQIAYAALDVTDPEPLPADHKLMELPNVIVAPHIASATVTSRTQMALIAVENLISGLQGDPMPHCVNPEVG
ncbi:MAG: D-glycerate dehydrogenase [Anaerolineales bacterium]|nr:D-glycerate dehydrogenase [Anaerolineales bacterium]